MGISFNHPWILILLPLVLFPVYLWFRDTWMEKPRRIVITSLRVVLLTLIILALAGIKVNYEIQDQNVVFVVDISASCEKGKEIAEQFIKEAVKNKDADDNAGVVVYGDNARIEQSISSDFKPYQIESLVERNYSNLQEGLKLADALMPDPSKKRLVIISDGYQNKGDALKEAENLSRKNVRIDVVPLKVKSGADVRIDTLEIPQKLYSGEKFSIKVRVNSNIDTRVKLRIYQDTEMVVEDSVNVHSGENIFVYTSVIDEGGFYSFRSSVEAINDTVPENNSASAYTTVHGKTSVLVVEGKSGEARAVVSALSSLGLDVDVTAPGMIPAGLDYINRYSAVILCNVSAESIKKETMEALEAAVRDLGTGLIMVGGDQSFGPGGYYKTPVEKALPVYMDLRGKAEIPSLALALVIDKSGSMSGGVSGYSKIDLAREAAIQATDILSPQDKVGVIAFDSAARWVVKMNNVEELEEIQADIATIRAGGGTNIYPAISLAYNSLKNAETKYKHIILLTDGQSATTGDYYYLARRMEKEGITMSTLAVGTDADIFLMQQLAEWGGGRYYFSDDGLNIPRIVTKETIKALREYIVEEEFVPVLTARTPLISGINELPGLEGYVATSPKKTASIVLSSHRGDPILAQWQYGLGRSVALTTDTGGRWSGQWVNWDQYNSIWGNIISWVLPRSDNDNLLVLDASITGSQGTIEVDSAELTECLPTMATIVTPGLDTEEVTLDAVAPGKYQGTFNAHDPGVYLMSITQQIKNSEEIRKVTGGITLSYSPEYRSTGTDFRFLEHLAEYGGGSVINEPEEAFADNLYPVKGSTPLWSWLLMAAALLLPVDIAARRLNITRNDMYIIMKRFRNISDESSGLGENEPVFARLRTRKNEIDEARSERKKVNQEKSPDKEKPSLNVSKPDTAMNEPQLSDDSSIRDQGVSEAKKDDNIGRLLNAKKRARK